MYTILKYAAMQGFKPLTVPMMQRLISYLEIDEAPRPTTEAQCATTLIKHVCPATEDDVLAFYLGQRHMRVKPKVDTFLSADLINCTSGIMAEAETEEAMRDINNFKRDVEALKTVALKLKSSNATKPNKLKAFAPCDSAALESARAYLPPGATLSQEKEWHSRWKASYDKCVLPPYSKSCSFDPHDADSARKALIKVLMWAWGQACLADWSWWCPWTFDDDVAPHAT